MKKVKKKINIPKWVIFTKGLRLWLISRHKKRGGKMIF